jgi:hypothetical protein
MAFLFVSINMFGAIIRKKIDDLTGTCVCSYNFWSLVLGGKDNLARKIFALGIRLLKSEYETGAPSILEFAVGVLSILVLMQVFEKFLSKLPTIVDSMVSIGGKEGGGLLPAGSSKGESRMGGGASAFGGATGGFAGLLKQVELTEKDKKGKQKTLGDVIGDKGGIVGGLFNKANEFTGKKLEAF